MELFTIIYAFMSHSLGLSGAAKEVFAVIFGFWKNKQAPVAVANSIVRKITGLSHSSVVDAKNKLVASKLITVQEIRGKPSLYEVHLPPNVSGILTPPDATKGASEKQTGRDISRIVNNSDLKNTIKTHGNKTLNVGNPEDFQRADKA